MSVNRDQILDSAAQIFCEKGYHGASMADIAQAVGLQKATLYHHFSSKQEILAELLDSALTLVTKNLAQVVKEDLPVEAKLRQAIRDYLQVICEKGNLSSVLIMEYRSLEKDLYQDHVRNRDRFEKMWRDLVQQGVDSGQFRSENVPMTIWALLGVMNWTINWYRPGGRLTSEDIADQFTGLFLEGIRSRNSVRRKKKTKTI
jgi:TetR/AcrR family transcriptional regulator, cholesterol catabolism regulator